MGVAEGPHIVATLKDAHLVTGLHLRGMVATQGLMRGHQEGIGMSQRLHLPRVEVACQGLQMHIERKEIIPLKMSLMLRQ